MSLQLDLQIAVAKVNKYAVSESGDTVEVVERPHGGSSVVVADGQRSGRSAKAISNIVVRKALSLLADGVRDGAVARATHDYLLTQRGGKVSAELSIVSIDLVTNTLVISRNARCPILLRQAEEWRWLDEPAEAVGVHRNTKPSISELPLAPLTTVVVCTDGIWIAGSRRSQQIDLIALLQRIDPAGDGPADRLADAILAEALALDDQRPQDDATVLVVKLNPLVTREATRRLFTRIPI
jgi:serine phosphatase RsbU (regulator of sigma subunit)